MVIYNQASTSKKYTSGILMGAMIIPAIFLFIQGYIIYGVALIIIYLAIETSRTGVDFDFGESRITSFRELLFFIKIRKGESANLNAFSHYRVKKESTNTSVMANWAQHSTISQEQCELELLDKQKGEFSQVVKSDFSELEPLLAKLEEQSITSKH